MQLDLDDAQFQLDSAQVVKLFERALLPVFARRGLGDFARRLEPLQLLADQLVDARLDEQTLEKS